MFTTAFTRVHQLYLSWSQLDPFHAVTSHLLKIHPNNILPSMPGSPNWPLSLRVPHQIFLKNINSCCTASFYSHFSSSTWRMQNIRSLFALLYQNTRCRQCPLLHSYTTCAARSKITVDVRCAIISDGQFADPGDAKNRTQNSKPKARQTILWPQETPRYRKWIKSGV
jgi:hypothetical protein